MSDRIQRAIQFDGAGVRLVERPIGLPGPGDALLQLETLGLCSSDFHIWSGRKSGAPGVLGHEGAGTVLAVGEGVRGLAPGEFVVVNPLLDCGECPVCREGRGHICERRRIVGYDGAGLMADVQILPARSLFRAPASLPRRLGAFVEPLACVIHGQRQLEAATAAGKWPPESLLILGAGPMGLLHALVARRHGVRSLWVVDPSEERLSLGRSRGLPVDEWIPLDDAPARVRRLSGGHGAEASVIANSARDGHAIAFELTRGGGAVLGFASILDAPGPLPLGGRPIDTDGIHRREGTITVELPQGPVAFAGAIGFDAASFAASADWLARGLDPGPLVTANKRLEDVPALVSGAWRSELKILIDPRGVSTKEMEDGSID